MRMIVCMTQSPLTAAAEITDYAGLMEVAARVASTLRQSPITYGDRPTYVRVAVMGSQVRFLGPQHGCIVELIRVSTDRSRNVITHRAFAGDGFYDPRFGEAMRARVAAVLA